MPRMDNESLRLLIRDKIQDGRLPSAGMPGVWGGRGGGETCDACAAAIAATEFVIEGVASDRLLHFHVWCFYAWDRELRHIETRAKMPPETARTPPSLHGLTVFVVDDDDINVYAWRTYLRHAGAEVTATSSGPGAIRMLCDVPFDVLVTDLVLPGTDGFAVLRAARECKTASRKAVAIAVTGFGDVVPREAALQSGFDAYLEKPVDPLVLALEIARRARPRD
jgi:CheY-like chemotaxis protein